MNPDLLGWLSAALLLLGGFVGLIGAIGVLRLPDCYTRMHSASKAGALAGIKVLELKTLAELLPLFGLDARRRRSPARGYGRNRAEETEG